MTPGSHAVLMCGASNGGILKDAAMVSESRSAKSTNVGDGTGRGETGENNFVKCASFQRHRLRLVAEVAANLAVPCVVEAADSFARVADAVSMALADKYVPVYKVCMRQHQQIIHTDVMQRVWDCLQR